MSLGHASEDLAKQAANVNYEQAVSSSDIHPVGQLLLYRETTCALRAPGPTCTALGGDAASHMYTLYTPRSVWMTIDGAYPLEAGTRFQYYSPLGTFPIEVPPLRYGEQLSATNFRENQLQYEHQVDRRWICVAARTQRGLNIGDWCIGIIAWGSYRSTSSIEWLDGSAQDKASVEALLCVFPRNTFREKSWPSPHIGTYPHQI